MIAWQINTFYSGYLQLSCALASDHDRLITAPKMTWRMIPLARILFSYTAHFQASVINGRYKQSSHDKCLAQSKILFDNFCPSPGWIGTPGRDAKVHLKWLLWIRSLFNYIDHLTHQVRRYTIAYTYNGTWMITTRRMFSYSDECATRLCAL